MRRDEKFIIRFKNTFIQPYHIVTNILDLLEVYGTTIETFGAQLTENTIDTFGLAARYRSSHAPCILFTSEKRMTEWKLEWG